MNLPDELVREIALHLSLEEIEQQFPQLLTEESFWEALLLRDFGIKGGESQYRHLYSLRKLSEELGDKWIQKELLEYIQYQRKIKFDLINELRFSPENDIREQDFSQLGIPYPRSSFDVCHSFTRESYKGRTMYFRDGRVEYREENLLEKDLIGDLLTFLRLKLLEIFDDFELNLDLERVLSGLMKSGDCKRVVEILRYPQGPHREWDRILSQYDDEPLTF